MRSKTPARDGTAADLGGTLNLTDPAPLATAIGPTDRPPASTLREAVPPPLLVRFPPRMCVFAQSAFVLSPPHVQRTVGASERTVTVERVLQSYAPPLLRAKRTFDRWWSGNPAKKWRRVLTLLLIIFVVRAITSFFSEYAFQKVGLSTVRDLRNQLYERIIHQSHRFFAERTTGEMISRVVSPRQQASSSAAMTSICQLGLKSVSGFSS